MQTWLTREQLPDDYPYDAMAHVSEVVDGVRMFPPLDEQYPETSPTEYVDFDDSYAEQYAARPLKHKHELFVVAYLSNFNGAKSAEMAGYKAAHAYLLMRRKDIRGEIERRFESYNMGREEVLARLTRIARGAGDYFDVDTDGTVSINVARMKQDGRADIIQKVRNSRDGQTIEFSDQLGALDRLAKVLNLYAPEKHELTGANGGPIEFGNISDDELIRQAKELFAGVAEEGVTGE